MRRNRSYRLVRRHGGLIHQRNQTSALSGRSSRFLVLPPPQTCRPVGLLLLYSCAKVQINKNKNNKQKHWGVSRGWSICSPVGWNGRATSKRSQQHNQGHGNRRGTILVTLQALCILCPRLHAKT